VEHGRIYPANFPEIEGEPTRSKFAIVTTENMGRGIMTRVPFLKGEVVFRFIGVVLPFQTLYTLQLDDTTFIEDRYCMGLVLHHCEPSLICDMKYRTFTATRDIQPCEYLTMDYETTEDHLYRAFDCECDAQVCRGRIAGKLATKGT
jgi:hypothetical protein